MGRSYSHLSREQRQVIADSLAIGKSAKDIAVTLSLHISTVYREIERGTLIRINTNRSSRKTNTKAILPIKANLLVWKKTKKWLRSFPSIFFYIFGFSTQDRGRLETTEKGAISTICREENSHNLTNR